jgi:hypothetical protein
MKLDLLTNASVVDDAARFVAEHNDKILQKKGISNNENEIPLLPDTPIEQASTEA